MMFFLIGLILPVLIMVVESVRRRARLKYVSNAERLRLRFSDLRHRLVMYAGSGEMEAQERKAVTFLYCATTDLLRHPSMYRELSYSACAALIRPCPPAPPKLRRKDFSDRTLGLLREYVTSADELIQTFAHPTLVFLAFLQGKRVLEMAREVGAAQKIIRTEKRTLREWRQAGAKVLEPGPLQLAA